MCAAVEGIAPNRAADAFEGNAELMRAAGMRMQFKQSDARYGTAALKLRNGGVFSRTG